jgi:hypothetical protein
MPAFTVVRFEGDIHPKSVPPASTSTPKLPRSTPRPHSKISEPSSALDEKILKTFCEVEPGSLDAADLVYHIQEGTSDLCRISRKRQIMLLYKVFQHCWLESLSELWYFNVFSSLNFSTSCLCQNLSIKERSPQPLDSM